MAAASKSASPITTIGSFPPHSSTTRLRDALAACRILAPVAVDPVNAAMWTSGCWTRYEPTSPSPWSSETSPGKRSFSPPMIALTTNSPESGTTSDGFTTMALPAISAGIERRTISSTG